MKLRSFFYLMALYVCFFVGIAQAQSIYEPTDLSKIKSSIEEMGKMWTFDAVPVDQFEKLYGFRPTEEWLDDVMKSALQFTNGCSAAFVSADGLIMTNHHCGRHVLPGLSPEGENYLQDGYYAGTFEKELKVKDLFVDQLLMIEDVTKEVIDAMNSGATDVEKVQIKNKKIEELQKKYSDETGLMCKVVQLYNGGKFSIYGYKRYDDIRLVMSPDFQIASTGWDWDNFTYPRYELDFMFFRAYENDKPVHTENYFKFSKNGAVEGEPIFTVGRPGSTLRLLSVAQLEYLKEKTYKYSLALFNEVYKVYFELFEAHPERFSELLNAVMSWGNARKSYAGRFMGLNDEIVMTKKKDFEKNLRAQVESDPELKAKYGHTWDAIKTSVDELKSFTDEEMAYNIPSFFKPEYFRIAEKVIKYAEQMKLAEDEREPGYKKDLLDSTIASIFPGEINVELQNKLVRAHINYVVGILGSNHNLTTQLYEGKKDEEAASMVLGKSFLTSKEKIAQLLKKSPDEILTCDDPFIYFLMNTQKKLKEIQAKTKEIRSTLAVLNQLLGEAAYKIYGNQLPPDATSTLRISDGVIKGYEYNGTIAPGKTTFFGLYDRWYSFGKKGYPWGLHPRWQQIPQGLDLSVPVAFASTNDIVGGNSGSSVINKNKEVIGLVHDGNLESLAGDFIFLESNNRTVATDSWGLMESLKYVFKTDRLVKELENGRM
ncbi:MAG: S46 family peptidase [Bacteroidota bacterium]